MEKNSKNIDMYKTTHEEGKNGKKSFLEDCIKLSLFGVWTIQKREEEKKLLWDF